MKLFLTSIFSFLLGMVLAGVIGYKLWLELAYEAVIGKLHDNVTFYRQIEEGKPEHVQIAVRSSLEWFIKMADEGEKSAWINDDETSSKVLTKAKELQSQLNTENQKTNKSLKQDK